MKLINIFGNTSIIEWLIIILLAIIYLIFQFIEPFKSVFIEGDLTLSYPDNGETIPYIK